MRILTLLLILLAPVLFGSMVLPEATAERSTRPGQDHALLFAVNDYSRHSGFEDLPNPITSAYAIAGELREMYAFGAEVVENPDKEQIYTKLQAYQSRTFGPDDQLFIFISGHGDFDEFEKKGYFVPRSGARIDLTTLGNIITQIPCRHILLAIDACYSGTIDQKIAFQGKYGRIGDNDDNARQQMIAAQLRNQSRLLLTSGTKVRTPSQDGGSPFAKAILSTLRGAYVDGDGLVVYKDLEAAMERVRPVPHSGKLLGHEDGSFVFVAKNVVQSPTAPDPVRQPVVPNPPDNMVFIQGGTFQMGDQFGDGYDNEKPVHAVTLSDFYLSGTELMVGEFADFIEATSYTTTAEKEGGSFVHNGTNFELKKGVTWRDDTAGKPRPNTEYNHPVVHVSWYDAVAYCNWLSGQHGLQPVYRVSGTTVTPDWAANGYRLPTEAEWEYAARSGGKKEKWAGTSTESSLSQFANYAGEKDGYPKTSPVGVLQANNLGLTDMSGNVWEWCWDWFDGDYYAKSPASNPRGAESGTSRVVRGGSWFHVNGWDSSTSICRAALRVINQPTVRNNNTGFRLARN